MGIYWSRLRGLQRRYEPTTAERSAVQADVGGPLAALAGTPSLDLDGYVTNKALDGLFKVVAEEEKKIRNNPAARTTDLLRKVFGGK